MDKGAGRRPSHRVRFRQLRRGICSSTWGSITISGSSRSDFGSCLIALARPDNADLERGFEAPIVGDAVLLHDKVLREMEATLSRLPWLAGEKLLLGRHRPDAVYYAAGSSWSRRHVGRAAERRAMVCRDSGTSELQFSDNGLRIYRLR